MGLCFYTCKVQLQTIHPRTFLFRTESSEKTGRIHPAGGHGALRARHCRRPRRQVRLQVRNWGTHECIGCGDTGQVFSPILTLEFCSFYLEIFFFFYHLIPFSSLDFRHSSGVINNNEVLGIKIGFVESTSEEVLGKYS